MNFGFSEAQKLLQQTTREFLEESATVAAGRTPSAGMERIVLDTCAYALRRAARKQAARKIRR